jgi:hypothetical protein
VAGAYRVIRHRTSLRASFFIGLAVFSHWVLDFIVHRPDLPLYDNTAKVGLGLWNYPGWAFGLEAALLFGGIVAYLRLRPTRRTGIMIFGLIMLGVQAYIFFGPPPVSPAAAASTALAAYVIFAVVIWWLADRPAAARTA